MKESTFRVIVGLSLLVALSFEMSFMILAIVSVLLTEGITNWRIPLLVCRLRGMPASAACSSGQSSLIPFDAERLLRLIVVGLLMVSYLTFPEYLWWLPWFIAFALLSSGLTEICPLVLALKWVGFR